ncbi:hypothetical protein N7536_000145 [Penicillium majusculum]|nr:hypothetical protein N7536_000145 [Penicillium majusculum]
MPPQRRRVASHRPNPSPLSIVYQGTQHPNQRLERIITSIYAEMSEMQQKHYAEIVMRQNCDNMLRAYAMDKAGLEKQNQCFIEHIKIAQQKACNLELKNRELEYQLAKERQQHPKQPEGRQS